MWSRRPDERSKGMCVLFRTRRKRKRPATEKDSQSRAVVACVIGATLGGGSRKCRSLCLLVQTNQPVFLILILQAGDEYCKDLLTPLFEQRVPGLRKIRRDLVLRRLFTIEDLRYKTGTSGIERAADRVCRQLEQYGC